MKILQPYYNEMLKLLAITLTVIALSYVAFNLHNVCNDLQNKESILKSQIKLKRDKLFYKNYYMYHYSSIAQALHSTFRSFKEFKYTIKQRENHSTVVLTFITDTDSVVYDCIDTLLRSSGISFVIDKLHLIRGDDDIVRVSVYMRAFNT